MFNVGNKFCSYIYFKRTYLAFICFLLILQYGVKLTNCKPLNTTIVNRKTNQTLNRNQNQTTHLPLLKDETIEADIFLRLNKNFIELLKNLNNKSIERNKLTNKNITNRIIDKKEKKKQSFELNQLVISSEKIGNDYKDDNKKNIFDYSMEYINDFETKTQTLNNLFQSNEMNLLDEEQNDPISITIIPTIVAKTTAISNELITTTVFSNSTLTTLSIPFQDNPIFNQCVNSCGSDHECIRQRCLLDSTYFG